MPASMVSTLLLALALLVCCLSGASASVSACGIVRDGLNEHVDMQIQISRTTIAANWSGFGDDVILAEWAIANATMRMPNSDGDSRCFSHGRISPDIRAWERLSKTATSTAASDLTLEPESSYVVLVRFTFRSGEQVTAYSDGVRVLGEEEAEHLLRHSGSLKEVANELAARDTEVPVGSVCPIDEANRCRQVSGDESVGDFLTSVYGQPQFAFGSLVSAAVFRPDNDLQDDDDDDGDDDDGGGAGSLWILAILAVLVLCCVFLLLALLIARLIAGGAKMPEREKKEKKPKPAKADLGEFADPLERKDYGMRTGVETGDATTETRVEFPDTQIRRLSITHDDAAAVPAAVAAESKSPRRKHPIMSSASSSFRDYRSVAR